MPVWALMSKAGGETSGNYIKAPGLLHGRFNAGLEFSKILNQAPLHLLTVSVQTIKIAASAQLVFNWQKGTETQRLE